MESGHLFIVIILSIGFSFLISAIYEIKQELKYKNLLLEQQNEILRKNNNVPRI